MSELCSLQLLLIGLAFVWSGFVRSGLGFGGAVLTLPFLLMIDNRPLVYLPIISVHLLFFASITVWQNNRTNTGNTHLKPGESTIEWGYLRYAIGIMIIPKLIGVFGLILLPNTLMSQIIFCIVGLYSLTYIFNKPFRSHSRKVDILFLVLGGYTSGTSLIGAPLIITVFANHIDKYKLRDTLFMLWLIFVGIKLVAFVIADVDLQLIHHLWLLPCAAIGHVTGLKFHQKMLHAETPLFFRVVGTALLLVSIAGFYHSLN